MSPLDISRSIPIATDVAFDGWLSTHGETEQEVIVAIYKKPSGKQTVTLAALQETALCHGWVDTQAKRIDDEQYAIRFTPRRSGSNWSDKNRRRAHRMLDEGRMRAAGIAALPDDL
ncbi:MAG: YdeI/OmpD-associated family protein [Acidimicrobiia bacterium]